MRFGFRVGACLAFAALLPLGAAGAATVAPDSVALADGEVAMSLTDAPGDPAAGKKWFTGRKLGNCLACHANQDAASEPFHGEVGPPLDGVADRYSEAEFRAILVDSKAVFGEATIMPAFYRVMKEQRVRKEFESKTILTAAQVEDVIAYLKTLKE